MSNFADRIDVFGRAVFFDVDFRDKIIGILKNADDWPDFIRGMNMHGFDLFISCNLSFSVRKRNAVSAYEPLGAAGA